MTQTLSAANSTPITAESFAEIFLTDTPLLDVRAPIEFNRGAFPTANNLPLLTDDERQQVGTRYRQAGQEAAIRLGHELVNGDTKAERIRQWQQWLQDHPNGLLYCFRGGLRSQLVQQWLQEAGVNIPRIAGGYKALRRFLIDDMQQRFTLLDAIIVAGKTGCGKTHLLERLPHSIDLEGYANHRGSAFGQRLSGQPGQIDFENRIAIALLKLGDPKQFKLFIEDESHAIGSLSVPPELFKRMKAAPLAVIEQPLVKRIDTILNDYILANFDDFEQDDPEQALSRFADYLRQALGRIRKRLGGEHFAEIYTLLDSALQEQQATGNKNAHRHWISRLLQDYYDPMYDYQLNKKLDRLVFRGNAEEFLDWAQHFDRDRAGNA